jgi:hypothetical protein
LGAERSKPRDSGAPGMARILSHDPFHKRYSRLTHFTDLALGGVLPLALSSFLGIQFLLLGDKLFDSRIW